MDDKSKTYGLSPGKLAELLNIGSQEKTQNIGKGDVRAMKLKEMLWQVSELNTSSGKGPAVIPEGLGFAIGLLAGEPVEDVILTPKSSLAELRKVKDHYNRMSEEATEKSDRDPAIVIYYAAIASGLIYHHKKISNFPFASLEKAFVSLAKKGWITPELTGLFNSAINICRKRSTFISVDNSENITKDPTL